MPAAAPDVFDAIASPVRRALLDRLSAGRSLPVHALAEGLAVSRPAVSQHLRVLREAGLVTEARVGREHHYRLTPGPLRQVEEWVTHYERFWTRRMGALRDLLEEQADD